METSVLMKGNQNIINSLFVDFVYHSNIGEDVGTQTREETTKCLEQYTRGSESSKTQQDRETTNTYIALEHVNGLFKDTMARTGLLTVQEICEIHRKLMNKLHPDCGNIRKTNVYTVTPDGEKYEYPHYDVVENALYTLIDHHNIHMEKLRAQDSSLSIYDKLVAVLKCASWLLFNFVDIHPFGDGNGRMCRLLAAYTMMVMIPFPIHPYYVNTEERPCRDDYIDAIISCRRHPKKEPSMIAALLVDALYYGWQVYLDCDQTA